MTDFSGAVAAFLTGGVCLKGIQLAETWWKGSVEERRKKELLWGVLRGLPDEMKIVLVNYYLNGAHTLRGNPGDPGTRQLVHMGILSLGQGGGSFDAVNSYMSIRPDVWGLMQERWTKGKEPRLLPLIEILERRE